MQAIHAKPRQRGFSLIELMVAVVIGMVLIAAITTMMVRQDAVRRTVTGANDVAMSGAFLSDTFDRELRSAGSGLTQGWSDSFGCSLRVAQGGTQILPATSAWPAPFDAVPTTIRLAPALVHSGAGAGGSDVLAVLTGAGGISETTATVVTGSSDTSSLRLVNTIGIKGGDLVLLSRKGLGCMVQEVAAPFTGGTAVDLKFGGTYAASTIDGLALETMSTGTASARLSLIGDATASRPRFQLFGINDQQRLVVLDLLRFNGSTTPLVLGEGLLDLRFLYGVDTVGAGQVTAWVSPASAGYTPAELTAGTTAAATTLSRILALRVGFVARGDVLERTAISPGRVTMFPSLPGLAIDRDLSAEEQRMRVRAYEIVVPLRNAILTSPRHS